MGERQEGGPSPEQLLPELLLKEPVLIKLPEDPKRVEAIKAKRDEYLGRIAKATNEFTHPEAAAVLGMIQGDSFCMEMLIRAELIDALVDSGDKGVNLSEFADSFLSHHTALNPSENDALAEAIRRQITEYDGQIIRAYCESKEDEFKLSGGTGLKIESGNE